MTQDEALRVLKTGANVFLTGEPGSGKTHTINAYIAWLRSHDIEPAITASTGIAATHIGGQTIHSWSGIGVRKSLTAYDLDHITQSRQTVRHVAKAQVLIIDEISMLSSDTLSMVDTVCRAIRQDPRPFGGLQVVLVGDFFQLPPITGNTSRNTEDVFSGYERESIFAFASEAWENLGPLVCYLSEQHRQDDMTFLDLLAAIRRGEMKDAHREILRARHQKSPQEGVTQLYAHNANVDSINTAELAKLSGKEKTYTMSSKGNERLVDALKRGCLSPEHLSLKVGARVMFTKNDYANHSYVNGTLGIVTKFSKSNNFPIVETASGDVILVEPADWGLMDNGRLLAEITQFPLRLAWAITVHKSQGMSLDAAHMDLSQTFEYGQGYVALSRVRTLEGLSIAGINTRALEVHPIIRRKDEEFRMHSAETQSVFGAMSAAELTKMHENFIRACDGTLEPIVKKGRGQKSKSASTQEVTRGLLLEHLSIDEIAKERQMTMGTIISHLEQLVEEKKISVEHLQHLGKKDSDIIEKAHDTFRKIGPNPLKPVFEHLDGRVSYETLRLARLLYTE